MYTALTLAAALSVGAPALKPKEEPLGKGPGYMGITFSQAEEGGLVITEVKPGGPAEKAGLKENDILLKANDTELKEMDTTRFVEIIGAMRPNQMVTFQVARNGEAMTVKVRYKQPEASESALMSVNVPTSTIMTAELGFASAVTEFGMLLRDSEFKGKSSFADVRQLANKFKGADSHGHRAEFIRLQIEHACVASIDAAFKHGDRSLRQRHAGRVLELEPEQRVLRLHGRVVNGNALALDVLVDDRQ